MYKSRNTLENGPKSVDGEFPSPAQHEVVESKRGKPIVVAALYCAALCKLGLAAQVLSLPGTE